MALGFFRRHQKMVIIVMVLLMGSFLIGPTAMNWVIGSGGPGELDRGTISNPAKVALTTDDTANARGDLDIFKAVLDVARRGSRNNMYLSNYVSTWQALIALNEQGDGDKTQPAYMLLVAEAQARGLEVSDPEVQSVLEGLNVTGQGLDTVLTAIISFVPGGTSGERVMDGIRRGLLVAKSIQLAVPMHPGSVADAREYFQEGRPISLGARFGNSQMPLPGERIRLQTARLEAEKYLPEFENQTPEPAALEAFFQQRQNVEPGQFPNTDSMGFGYRRPRRMEIQWLLVDREVIELATMPEPNAIARWIAENEDILFKEVPVEAPEQQGDAQEESTQENQDQPEQADEEEPKTVRKEMEQSEKEQRAIQALGPDLVKARLGAVVTGLQAALIDTEPDPENRYPELLEKLTSPAGSILDQKLNLSIYKVPLKTALDDIQKEIGVQIVFPVGKYANVTIDGDVLVSASKANGGTLGETLKQLGESLQVPLGPEAWHTFRLVPGAIFPKTDLVNMLPVRYGTTGLATVRELQSHPILLQAQSNRQSILGSLPREEEALERRLELEGRVMDLGPTGQADRLLWRLAKYVPSTAPDQLTEELRPRVIEDWRLAQAYQLALEKAKAAVSDVESMRSFAQENDLEITHTPLMTMAQAHDEFFPQLVGPETASEIDIDHPQFTQLWEEWIDLAPENPTLSYPPAGEEVKVVPVPAGLEVLLVRRLDYEPAVDSQFRRFLPQILNARYSQEVSSRALRSWLTYENIAQRTQYDPEGS